ncbi:MAG: hypothetical protein ACI4GD_05170 [Lachnospiraceae bacterium]
MKKISLIMATVLVLAGMSGCGKSDNTPDDQTSDTTAAVRVDIETQTKCIAEHSNEWINKDDKGETHFYAVTDLDYNGRLEVVDTCCSGSGFFSTTVIYEVNEKADGFNVIHFPENVEPDILNGYASCYTEGNEHWYIMEDSVYDDLVSNNTVYAIMLENGNIQSKVIGSYTTDYSNADTYNLLVEYRNADGVIISEDEYYGLQDEMFGYYEWSMVTLDFRMIEDYDDLTDFAKDSYNSFMMPVSGWDSDGSYELSIYTNPLSEAYNAAASDVNKLDGVAGGAIPVRFVCTEDNVEVKLEKVEWIEEYNYFHTTEYIFDIYTEKDKIYEFPATLSEGIPQYRLNIYYWGDSNVWYLSEDGYGDSDVIVLDAFGEHEERELTADDAIISLCKAYAGMLSEAGSIEKLEGEYFWKTVGNAVALERHRNRKASDDGTYTVDEWMMEAYVNAMFPYVFGWAQPEKTDPVSYSADGTYIVDDILPYDDAKVELLQISVTEYGMYVLDFVIHGEIDMGVEIHVLPEYEITSDNPFGFYISDADIAEG